MAGPCFLIGEVYFPIIFGCSSTNDANDVNDAIIVFRGCKELADKKREGMGPCCMTSTTLILKESDYLVGC